MLTRTKVKGDRLKGKENSVGDQSPPGANGDRSRESPFGRKCFQNLQKQRDRLRKGSKPTGKEGTSPLSLEWVSLPVYSCRSKLKKKTLSKRREAGGSGPEGGGWMKKKKEDRKARMGPGATIFSMTSPSGLHATASHTSPEKKKLVSRLGGRGELEEERKREGGNEKKDSWGKRSSGSGEVPPKHLLPSSFYARLKGTRDCESGRCKLIF